MLRISSLKKRLTISGILLLVIIMPAIGFTLNSAFETHLLAAIEKELSAKSFGILAESDYIDGQFSISSDVMDSEFNVIDSSVYAFVVRANPPRDILWQSRSALNLNLPEHLPLPEQGERMFIQLTAEQRFFVSSFAVSYSSVDSELPVILYIIESQEEFLKALHAFQQQMLLWLLVIIAAFASLLWAWLGWTLKPLSRLSNEIKAVELGESEQINKTYPDELVLVTHQLNHLLKTEQQQRSRYRNALSDLAHSLKTPLAGIKSTQDISDEIIAEVDKINDIVEHQLKRAQSAGQTSWRLSVSVLSVLTKLESALLKIYRDKALTLTISCDKTIKFRGDEADLMELLGNLLDNACKAANSVINVNVKTGDSGLTISVADDGKGISSEEADSIMQRGVRADTYEQGHGIGLAIVRDLVSSYEGSISVGNDEILGGAQFSLKFPANR
ncbi:ATP-binding protein [Thalassotalea euphylliae]|uniref:ATP-binding protein n=1 Tax=Thalassotalea euphylliae TaxID=1655234 RepID=UPI00363F3A9C